MDVMRLDEFNKFYLEDVLEYKKYILKFEVEKFFNVLFFVLNVFYGSYNCFKLVDMKFSDFEVDG